MKIAITILMIFGWVCVLGAALLPLTGAVPLDAAGDIWCHESARAFGPLRDSPLAFDRRGSDG